MVFGGISQIFHQILIFRGFYVFITYVPRVYKFEATLLQDGMLNSTPQQGCIWTKVFLARKVFLASGQGQYMLKNGFFQS